jgi:hypothetical protein
MYHHHQLAIGDFQSNLDLLCTGVFGTVPKRFLNDTEYGESGFRLERRKGPNQLDFHRESTVLFHRPSVGSDCRLETQVVELRRMKTARNSLKLQRRSMDLGPNLPQRTLCERRIGRIGDPSEPHQHPGQCLA